MKNILVTGASGYIAKHCIAELVKEGFSVKGTVRDLHKGVTVKEDLENSASGLEEIDGVSVTVAGLSYERYVYMLEITDSFQESLVVAIVLAFVIVLIVLRDVRLSLILFFL